MKYKVFKEVNDLYDFAFNLFKEEIIKNPSIKLGLATGGTPVPLYKRLVKDYQENKTDYSLVSTYNLDEYIGLDRSHPQSYHYFMNDILFRHININLNNCHIPSGVADNLEEEAFKYHKLVVDANIDIQLLGLGSNAHIAFNEPGTSFDSITQIVSLTEQTKQDNKRFFEKIEDVPTTAITMGIKDILNAKWIVLIAAGENKADAVYNMIKGPVTEDVPASVLQNHPNVLILVDEEAAKKLW